MLGALAAATGMKNPEMTATFPVLRMDYLEVLQLVYDLEKKLHVRLPDYEMNQIIEKIGKHSLDSFFPLFWREVDNRQKFFKLVTKSNFKVLKMDLLAFSRLKELLKLTERRFDLSLTHVIHCLPKKLDIKISYSALIDRGGYDIKVKSGNLTAEEIWLIVENELIKQKIFCDTLHEMGFKKHCVLSHEQCEDIVDHYVEKLHMDVKIPQFETTSPHQLWLFVENDLAGIPVTNWLFNHFIKRHFASFSFHLK